MSDSEIARLYEELRGIRAKLDALAEALNRLGKHSVRLQHVEEKVELAHSRLSELKKLLWGGLVAAVSTVAAVVWDFIRSAFRH